MKNFYNKFIKYEKKRLIRLTLLFYRDILKASRAGDDPLCSSTLSEWRNAELPLRGAPFMYGGVYERNERSRKDGFAAA